MPRLPLSPCLLQTLFGAPGWSSKYAFVVQRGNHDGRLRGVLSHIALDDQEVYRIVRLKRLLRSLLRWPITLMRVSVRSFRSGRGHR
jgi:hypothetical protein